MWLHLSCRAKWSGDTLPTIRILIITNGTRGHLPGSISEHYCERERERDTHTHTHTHTHYMRNLFMFLVFNGLALFPDVLLTPN
jgi:hypothetical protein